MKINRFWLVGAPAAAAALIVLRLTAHTMCLIYATTGFPCPACGSTRAVFALLRGDVLESLRWHPLVAILPVLGVLALYVRLRPLRPPRWWNPVLAGVLALYLAVYAVRLVLLFPHTEPMVVNEYGYLPRLWQAAANFFSPTP
jgi:hypothetical protein